MEANDAARPPSRTKVRFGGSLSHLPARVRMTQMRRQQTPAGPQLRVSDRIRKVFLLPVVAEIGKGQYYNRQPGRTPNGERDYVAGGVCVVLAPGDRCNKAVAAPRNRLDAAALLAVAIEDTAQRCNLDIEVAVLDRSSVPDGLNDLASRDE